MEEIHGELILNHDFAFDLELVSNYAEFTIPITEPTTWLDTTTWDDTKHFNG